MRQTTVILFLTLFLFNLIGYKGWFFYLQQKESASLEASLDKEDYNEKDLITFKVPLNMPYQTGWSEFERVDGEITVNGVIYKYVKRKIEDGQLIVLCLPNYKKMSLLKTAAEFGTHSDDPAAAGKKGRASSDRSSSPNEYEEHSRWSMTDQAGTLLPPRRFFLLSPLSDGVMDFPAQPPRLV